MSKMREGPELTIKYFLLATISGTIIALDQLTKLIILTHFHYNEQLPVVQNFFDLTYVRNSGAAFGILASAPQFLREPFFALIPLIALVVIVLILRNTNERDKIQIIALSLIFGGAVGNYIDRLRFGYVVDFLDFHWRDVYHWPAFNIADSAIVCGVVLMVMQMLFHKSPARQDSKAA